MDSKVFHSCYRPDLFLGERVLITGGGTGIGRCVAHELASLGAHVIIAGRRKDVLEATRREIVSVADQRCDIAVMNVRNEKDVIAAVEDIGLKVIRNGKKIVGVLIH